MNFLQLARISRGLRLPKRDSLSEPKELCFNILREFLNRRQASYPGFDDGGPRIQDTLHFPQCRNNKEIAGDNSWHRVACRTKNSWWWLPLDLLCEMLKVISCFYNNCTLKDSKELFMLCTGNISFKTGVACGKYTCWKLRSLADGVLKSCSDQNCPMFLRLHHLPLFLCCLLPYT